MADAPPNLRLTNNKWIKQYSVKVLIIDMVMFSVKRC